MQLELKDIGYQFDGKDWLFRGVNLEFNSNEVVGLVAPSGFGKTTLCQIIAGWKQPKEGLVLMEGKEVPKAGYHPVQLICQHPEKAINPNWQMKKVLSEGGEPDEEVLKILGIKEEWSYRRAKELSGGELQRFCITRAIGAKTKFLIADEMTTMLDAVSQAQIWHAVLEIAKEKGMGIIVVSHEKALINRICDRVVYLEEISCQ